MDTLSSNNPLRECRKLSLIDLQEEKNDNPLNPSNQQLNLLCTEEQLLVEGFTKLNIELYEKNRFLQWKPSQSTSRTVLWETKFKDYKGIGYQIHLFMAKVI